jgi:hypothetical protein
MIRDAWASVDRYPASWAAKTGPSLTVANPQFWVKSRLGVVRLVEGLSDPGMPRHFGYWFYRRCGSAKGGATGAVSIGHDDTMLRDQLIEDLDRFPPA